MYRIKVLFSCVSALLSLHWLCAQQIVKNTEHQLMSPDKNYVFSFYQKESAGGKKQLYYTVSYKNQPVILESAMGVLIRNQLLESALAIENDTSAVWGENLDFKRASRSTQDSAWQPLYGERNRIPDQYNELVLAFEKYGAGNVPAEGHSGTAYDRRRSYELDVKVRAYNEGIAFRYFFPENSNGLFLHITGEQTQFAMPAGTLSYYERWAQGPYQLLPLDKWPDESERPLTLKLQNGLTVALLEAQMIDYVRTKFKVNEKRSNTIEASLYGSVDAIAPYATPWRVIMAAEKPGMLLENNYIILNLNDANKISNTSWIKPGKAFRSGLSNTEAMAAVDFAAARSLQYVHLDAGWYGPEMKVASDASRVAANRDLDMQKLINYAAGKGIGILFYVNQRALYQQLDSLLPLYHKWGVKGVKFGFVQVGSQQWSTWLHHAVQKAAENQLMVDIHDEYRPTGFSRTYPNLMSQEGIRGNEEMPEATHNTILPFTRYLAGAGDYTVSYYVNRIKTTHAHQLAMSVISYSPIQFLYWYDKPSSYKGEPEIEFFDRVKTVWDDTKVISGEIGEHIAMARRSGAEWFVGTLTNNDGRSLNIPLSFLTPGKKYVATIYSDDPKVRTATHVKTEIRKVNHKTLLTVNLLPSGGQAMWIRPE